MDASINLNDTIQVCLNKKGWAYLERYYIDLFSSLDGRYKKHVEKYMDIHRSKTKQVWVDDNYKDLTEFQLSEFMNIFGSHLYCGSEAFIENNRIYLSIIK